MDPAPGWRAGGAPFQPPWRLHSPGAPPKARSSLSAEGWENRRRSHVRCGGGTRGNGGATLDGIWCRRAEPRGGLLNSPGGDGRSRQRGAGSQLDCGRQSPGRASPPSGAGGGRGGFPDQVWEARIAWNGRPLLVRVRQCPSSPRLPSKPSGKLSVVLLCSEVPPLPC